MVEIETDEGITGIGETDLNAWIARACIEAPGTHTMDRGLRPLLIGRDPTDVEAIWQELYVGSCMSGRRGALMHAIGALDIALWDLRGKAEGVPCWQLWGKARGETLTPYASLQPEVSSFDAYLESMVALGHPRPRPGLHGGQAGGDLRRAVRTQGPCRGRTSGSCRSCARCGRPPART